VPKERRPSELSQRASTPEYLAVWLGNVLYFYFYFSYGQVITKENLYTKSKE
jgi:hypothetical protein